MEANKQTNKKTHMHTQPATTPDPFLAGHPIQPAPPGIPAARIGPCTNVLGPDAVHKSTQN